MNLKSSKLSALIQTYAQYPIEIVKGDGSSVWDSKSKKYLDFYGGHAVCLLGHCPPQVVKAIKEQSEKLIFYSNIFKTNPAIQLADKLAGTLKEPYQVYFANSGSEANETALKIARKKTGKKHIIAFKNSFHGRSISALGVTGLSSYHQFEPNLDEYTCFADLGDMESIKKVYNKDVAAVICEPIQSIGGIKMAETKFYKKLAEFCEEKNILLIFDEVQTGLGRTGTFWFCQSVGVIPDVITTAKGIASGLPLSAVLVKEDIAKTIGVGEHATTFGGGLVVCAAGLATIKMLLENDFEVEKKGEYLKKRLKSHPQINQIHGKGLLIGIEFKKPAQDLPKLCLKNGLIIGSSSIKNIIRIMPPLNVSWEELNQFLEIFTKSIKQLP